MEVIGTKWGIRGGHGQRTPVVFENVGGLEWPGHLGDSAGHIYNAPHSPFGVPHRSNRRPIIQGFSCMHAHGPINERSWVYSELRHSLLAMIRGCMFGARSCGQRCG